jgi:uncharacterized protein YecT (DUF1311 family)
MVPKMKSLRLFVIFLTPLCVSSCGANPLSFSVIDWAFLNFLNARFRNAHLPLAAGLLSIFGLAPAAFAQIPNAVLNDAYRSALHSSHVDPEFLKWTEIHWITYRDAEADLQGRLAGGGKIDLAAKDGSLKISTELRIQELLHLAKDGFSGDLSDGATNQATDAVADAYRNLRMEAQAKGDPLLMSAVIADQKAWFVFSDLQADYDGYRPNHTEEDSNHNRQMSMLRMDRLRLAQLQNALSKLGISAKASATPAGPVTMDQDDRSTELSPDGSIRIEQSDGAITADDTGQTSAPAWVVSNKTGQREKLPLDDEKGVGRGNPTVAISEYAISPDDQWIFRTQKFYHGMCGAYLYRRVSDLKYEKATLAPLDIMAWKFFQGHAKGFADTSQGGVVNFVKWRSTALRISLNASDRLTFGNVGDWQVDYDLKTGSFSIPADQIEHDRQAVDESHR